MLLYGCHLPVSHIGLLTLLHEDRSSSLATSALRLEAGFGVPAVL